LSKTKKEAVSIKEKNSMRSMANFLPRKMKIFDQISELNAHLNSASKFMTGNREIYYLTLSVLPEIMLILRAMFE
jgi:hypothetical protein